MYRVYAECNGEEVSFDVSEPETDEALEKLAEAAAGIFRQKFGYMTEGTIFIDVYQLGLDQTVIGDPVYMDTVVY